MKWHSQTATIISVATVMAVGRVFMGLSRHDPLSTWAICLGGMALLGAAFGFIVALVASLVSQLRRRF